MAVVTKKGKVRTLQTPAPDRGPWRTQTGVVLTDDDAAVMAAAFESDDFDPGPMTKRPVGRPGSSRRAATGPSPRVSVRVEATAHKMLKERAEAEHRTVSDLAREAIEVFVAK